MSELQIVRVSHVFEEANMVADELACIGNIVQTCVFYKLRTQLIFKPIFPYLYFLNVPYKLLITLNYLYVMNVTKFNENLKKIDTKKGNLLKS